jgi:coenzyme F420-0:L-glutamate ligase/coenzyme F420-1:gamma-L-glutamate ligase
VIQIVGVGGLPEILPGDDLAALVVDALAAQGEPLRDGDVLVFTSKVVSKAEGRLVVLADVTASAFAEAWAAEYGKDPRHVEVVLREARRVVRMERGVLIAETRHGFICANAGVDASNSGRDGTLVLLPEDPDASARALRAAIGARTGTDVAIVISDTFGRAWRVGQTNVAIGAAGIPALRRYLGQQDPEGRTLRSTSIAVIDELAGAAELVMGKLDRVAVALIRGYAFAPASESPSDAGEATEATPEDSAAALVRQREFDLFR